MQRKKIVLALFSLLLTDLTIAQQTYIPPFKSNNIPNTTENNLSTWHAGPWTSRFSGQGLLGRNIVAGFVDGMIPIIGQNDRLIYLDGTAMGGQSSNAVAGVGTGIRQIKNVNHTDVILGGFAFADYQQMQRNSQAWIVNPGVELLTRHNEARVQGYIPLSRRSRPFASLMASEIPQSIVNDSGQTNNLSSIQGHNISDTPVNLTHEYGLGIEGEVGHYLPIWKGAWIRGGAYHFSYKNAQSINGVEANVELFTGRNLAVIVQENYDNQDKNKISVGLRFNFGGPDITQVNNLENRMEEPVIRHLARQPSGMASPVRDSFVATGPTETTSGIWFFSRSGTNQSSISLSSCTAENPCLNLDQTVADGIAAVAPNATLWFATGTYVLPTTGTDGFVNLADGQSLFGRSLDFRTIAVGTNRPTIEGGLWWNGNGSFNNMQINNAGQFVPNAGPNTVSALGSTGNLTVNKANVLASGTSTLGIYAVNNAYATDSTISVTGSDNSYGIYGTTDAVVSHTTVDLTETGLGQAFGIASEQHHVYVNNNSNITVTSPGGGPFTIGVISFAANGNIYIQDSIVHATGLSSTVGISSVGGDVFARNTTSIASGGGNHVNGIFAENNIVADHVTASAEAVGNSASLGLITNTGNIQVSNSSVITATGEASVWGISANGGNVSIMDSSVASRSNSVLANRTSFGIFAQETATVNNSTIKAENSSALATGITRGIFTQNNDITFEGIGSHVSAESTTLGTVVAVQSIGGVINNNSTPKSQCSINGGPESDC